MQRHLFILCLLAVAYLNLNLNLNAQTNIQLTFTAEANGNHQSLDSVLIENITQGGDTILYGTDTVLVLDHGIGINDRVSDHGDRMVLFPAYPNPVNHTSTIRIWLPQDAPITLRLFDLQGRGLITFNQLLGAGEHAFTFYPGKETFYILVAEALDQRVVQKITSLSQNEGICRISYAGHLLPAQHGLRKGKSVFPWLPGDDLRFIGYTPLGVDTINHSPVQSTVYTFQFIPPVPPPAANFSVSDTLVYINDTVYFTDLSSFSPTTWKWFFGDGDSSTIQNPLHIYTGSGVYTVTLIVSNAGGTDTLTKTSQIDVIPPYPAGTVHCNPSNPTAVYEVTNPITGRIWMDRNLGASQVAASISDTAAYGDLYQWGRFADGHQCRISATTNTLSNSDAPGHGNFISAPSPPYDWRSPQNTNLWQGVNGVNNPCPIGYRLPTEAELNAERLSWSSNNSSGAFASPLKLLMAGRRAGTGLIWDIGSLGIYWSGTVSGTYSRSLYFLQHSSAGVQNYSRATGSSIRCTKDY